MRQERVPSLTRCSSPPFCPPLHRTTTDPSLIRRTLVKGVSTQRWGYLPRGGGLRSEMGVSAQRWESLLSGGSLFSEVGISVQKWESFSLLEALRSRVGGGGRGPCGPDPHSISPCAPGSALPPWSPKWFSHQWQELTRKKTELDWEPSVDRIRLLTKRSQASRRRNSALPQTDTPACH